MRSSQKLVVCILVIISIVVVFSSVAFLTLRRDLFEVRARGIQTSTQHPPGFFEHFESGGRFIGATPSASPDGRYIAFAMPRTGRGDIYVVNIETGEQLQLTASDKWEGMPRFADVGYAIVYLRENEGRIQIVAKEHLHAAEHVIGAPGDYYIRPLLTADGEAVIATRYFRRDAQGIPIPASAEIVYIDIASGAERRITNNNIYESATDVSRDGSLLLFEKNDLPFEVWSMVLADSTEQYICTGSSAAFMNGDDQLVFNCDAFAQQIALINLDGTNLRTILSSRTYKAAPQSLGAARSVVFLSEPRGRGVGTIVVLDTEKGTVQQVVGID